MRKKKINLKKLPPLPPVPNLPKKLHLRGASSKQKVAPVLSQFRSESPMPKSEVISSLPKIRKKQKKKSARKIKKKKVRNKNTVKKEKNPRLAPENFPTLKIMREYDIAMDFATKAYKKFSKLIKSMILFGSSVKNTALSGSDIDMIIIIDDAAVQWDAKLIAWYREELGKLIFLNPYKKELHINTVKLTTWWQDLMRGDPVVMNVIRYGESLIDFGGFFNPLKVLLQEGRIKSTPEAVYTCLQRAPQHLARSKAAELATVEGIYWSMVDSAHALLIASKVSPPSPEHIPILLKENFVDNNLLKMKYVVWYRDLYVLHRKIVHGDITDIKGLEIDDWQDRAEQFIRQMAELIEKIVKK
jgi:uncharacterized protein (UPF0332 family)/predicted nucleotidyltransferase